MFVHIFLLFYLYTFIVYIITITIQPNELQIVPQYFLTFCQHEIFIAIINYFYFCFLIFVS